MPLSGTILETTVNQTSSQVLTPSVATDGSSSYVFVWEGVPLLDTESRVLGAMYTASPTGLIRDSGHPEDIPLALNSFGAQHHPHVAVNANRTICVVWTDQTLGPSAGRVMFKVYTSRLDPSNELVADSFIPIDSSNTNQDFAKVAFSNTPTQDLAVAWLETTPNLVNVVRVAVYNNTNTYALPIFEGTITDGGASSPSALDIRMDCNAATGDFFAVWESDVVGSSNVIMGVKFNASGVVGPANGFSISDPTLPPDDDQTDATGPRIAVRPNTGEFVVSWMRQTPLITNNMFFNIFWRRMSMDGVTPTSIITPTPGIIQVPGAVAAFQGGVASHGDGTFFLTWVDSDGVSVYCTEYGWHDATPNLPPTTLNAPLIPSSGRQDGGFLTNGSTSSVATSPELVAAGDAIVEVYSDFFTMANINAKMFTVTDAHTINDYETTFTAPALFGIGSLDNSALALLSPIFGSPTAPGSRDTTNLDSFLGSDDLVIVGGPISNSMANSLMFVPALAANLSDTEAVSFSIATLNGDGRLFGSAAPSFLVQNRNSPTVGFTLQRSNDGTTTTDYALIVRLSGSTHNLLYVAGIRDWGTAIAAYVLSNVNQGEGTSTVASDILRLWTNVLNNSSAVFVKFQVPFSTDENSTPAQILATQTGAGITLIPAQSIASNNP